MTGEEYNHINDVMQDLYQDGKLSEDDFDFICKVIDDADMKDKYRWHDLKKNPEDLPADNTDKLVHTDEGSYAVAYYRECIGKWCFYNPDINHGCSYIEESSLIVDGWREIEKEVSE